MASHALSLAIAAPAAESTPRTLISFWVPAAAYLGSIVYYFTLIDSEYRIVAPAAPIICVGVIVVGSLIFRRRLPAINREMLYFQAAFLLYALVTLAFNEPDPAMTRRKIILPLVCMAPAIFRYYITPRQLLVYIGAFFLIGVIFTTQSWDVVSRGFLSTDSPTESILGIPFGALAVWCIASRQWTLGTLAWIACLIFFKRNAIVLSAGVIALLAIQRGLTDEARLHMMRRVLIFAAPVLAVLALSLNRIFALIATYFGRGLDAEFISVGRAPIYDLVIRDYSRSGLLREFLGNGAGSIEQLIGGERSLNEFLLLAHNEYLSFLYDFGAVGMILLFGLLLRNARSGTPACAVLLYTFASMSAENYFLVSFINFGVLCLLSLHLVTPEPPAARVAAP